MRRAHFCAERAAEKEQRGIVKFSDVVQRRRGGRAVQVAALLLAAFSAVGEGYLCCSGQGGWISSSSRMRRWVAVRRSRWMPSGV
jgi:hypothetical protein